MRGFCWALTLIAGAKMYGAVGEEDKVVSAYDRYLVMRASGADQ